MFNSWGVNYSPSAEPVQPRVNLWVPNCQELWKIWGWGWVAGAAGRGVSKGQCLFCNQYGIISINQQTAASTDFYWMVTGSVTKIVSS